MVSQKTRFDVFKRDGFTCQYCGCKSPEVILEVDHVTPVSKGGTNDFDNLITSCRKCNRGKSDNEVIPTELEVDWNNICSIWDKQSEVKNAIEDYKNKIKEELIKLRELNIGEIDNEIRYINTIFENPLEDLNVKTKLEAGDSLENVIIYYHEIVGEMKYQRSLEESKNEFEIKIKLDETN
jgi:CRISPR/Cas system Type II protein with McrA/HNH and RuvC-like nuclease domain